MKTSKWLVAFSLIMVLSMILAACAPATQEATPQEPEVIVETVEVVTTQEVVKTEVVVQTVEVYVTPTPPPTTRTGAWVDQVVFTSVDDANAAVSQIQAGELDIYAYTIDDAELFKTVESDPNLIYSNSYGSSNEISYNPSVCTDTTKLNPFANTAIREATNWLYDRNYVVQEISGGLGAQKFLAIPFGFPDYTKYVGKVRELEAKYAYNPEKAKEIITAEMEGLGATLGADGKWQFNGAPVTLIGLIRTEDERSIIGDYVATQLESVGFTVDRQFKTRSEASPIWVQSDPTECLYNYYTGGWINTAIDRDLGDNFSFYYTPQQYPIPMFQAYAPSPEFDEVALKLFTNDFTTLEERDELFVQAMEMSLSDPGSGSVRVWLNDSKAFTPQSADTVVAADLAGSVSGSQLWPYTARFVGQEGGVLRIAQPGILVEPWNPLGGSNWIYDMMLNRAISDWGTVFDPFTGNIRPQRIETASVVVQEGLPVGKTLDWLELTTAAEITVPPEAWVDWDPVNQVFITAGEKFPEGLTAKTKSSVCYPADLFDTIKWHDGSPLSPSDFVFNIIAQLDPGYEDSANYDEAIAQDVSAFLSHWKGAQITSTDPFCIDNYDDLFYTDAEYIVEDWWPEVFDYGTGGAWHALGLGFLADADGKLAFSADKADAKGVEWMSFIAGPSLEILKGYLDTATAESYIPFAPTMGTYVTADEAAARYANLATFYAERNHFFVGTGPFFLYRVFPVEQTVTLQRNPDFPDLSNKWSIFGEPKLPVAEVDGPGQIATGEEATFDVFVTFKEEPYTTTEMTGVKYLVFDANGALVTEGEATNVADGQYQVVLPADVTGTMTSGSYKMEVAAVSSLVSIPGFATFEFIVP